MDNAVYVGLSRQMVLQRQMDIIANNIANADTSGFKVESLMMKTDPESPAATIGGPNPVKFVTSDGVARDFSQGGLHTTGASFDVGIEGQGFFQLAGKNGDRFTRDGHFHVDGNGALAAGDGSTVAGDGGGQITIDPEKGPVQISADGVVSQGIERVGKIGVVTFDNLSGLEKTGDNQLKNTSNLQPKAADNARVRQGMLEGSNVQPVVEITRMIEVSRAYEQISKIMDSQADLSRTAIQRMGKAN